MSKISAQLHTTLCIQFLDRENNDKKNTFPLGKQICFTVVWSCAEILLFNEESMCMFDQYTFLVIGDTEAQRVL